jgi:predicted kinase
MRPRLILMCGLPGAGESTLARQIEAGTGAVRFCGDEWTADLGLDYYDEIRHRLWPRLERLWQQVLTGGLSVILEDGTWQRTERDALREFAAAVGALTEMHYFDIPFNELWRRLKARNAEAPYGSAPITHEVLTDCWTRRFQRPDVAELELFDQLAVHPR